MGPAVYDSRIRPSGINQTGKYKEILQMDGAAAFENLNSWVYSTEENTTKLLLGIKEDILLFKFPFFFLDGATFVYVNVFVRSFSAINDVKMVCFLLFI